MKICVVGSGYVGLVASIGFCELGHQVVCVDNDQAKLQKLMRGVAPIHEEWVPELLEKHSGIRLTFSSNLAASAKSSEAIFIAVGTPSSRDGDADLSYVEAVARELAGAIGRRSDRAHYKVIVEKSTVPVYTNEWIRRVLLLNGASADNFDVVSNPEFLREGTAVVDFLYPDRIVVGADSDRAAAVMASIYAPLTAGEYYRGEEAIPGPINLEKARLILTSTKSAELIKHASNAFLATKISFINAVANICEAVGANIEEVAEGIGADSRIGSRFLNPGIGYGGSCFPKDLRAFTAVAKAVGYDFRLLEEVEAINEEQRKRFLKKVRSVLWTLKGKRIAVLGLAFKGGTDDIRESPALPIVAELLRENCTISAYDPAAMERAKEVFPEACIEFTETAYQAIENADALLILTEWEEFGSLDLTRVKSLLRYPIVVDGRNMLDAESAATHGLTYISIGRPVVHAKEQSAAPMRETGIRAAATTAGGRL